MARPRLLHCQRPTNCGMKHAYLLCCTHALLHGNGNGSDILRMTELPFNLFDILLGAVLVAGLIHGRKHGLSRELVGLVKWIALLLGSALIYQPVGKILASRSEE